MGNLLATDFRRVFKDKLFWITAILGVVFALITPLLYAVLFHGLDQEMMTLMGVTVDAKSQFFTAFHFGDNFGLVAPVLMAIVICKDFSYGTVRNKIIGGYSRASIFGAMFITCGATVFLLMLCHALLSLGCSLLFFPYQQGDFTIGDFGYLVTSLGLELLCYLFVTALVCCLCVTMKNVGLTVVVYVAVAFLMTLLVSVLQIASALVENETLSKIVEFLCQFNVYYQVGQIGSSDTYTAKQIISVVLSSVVPAVALGGLGLFCFRKKDLK